ncbi:DUF6314 family protein [Algicella marina]|uniref:DUF6314 family protein n=1 Tax=Algicella marina TaxID=2683284 RepID=UPI0024E0049B|nr:DUF6314 family protein [Algicella marina]
MKVTSITDLHGSWRLRRRVRDAFAGQHATFEGSATFTRAGANWLYRETGTLSHSGGQFQASRQYLFDARPNGVAVSFDDGRPFHEFSWVAPIARHDCSPDRYHVAYRFSDWPRWSVGYCVCGPRKSYTISSEYCRP